MAFSDPKGPCSPIDVACIKEVQKTEQNFLKLNLRYYELLKAGMLVGMGGGGFASGFAQKHYDSLTPQQRLERNRLLEQNAKLQPQLKRCSPQDTSAACEKVRKEMATVWYQLQDIATAGIKVMEKECSKVQKKAVPLIIDSSLYFCPQALGAITNRHDSGPKDNALGDSTTKPVAPPVTAHPAR